MADKKKQKLVLLIAVVFIAAGIAGYVYEQGMHVSKQPALTVDGLPYNDLLSPPAPKEVKSKEIKLPEGGEMGTEVKPFRTEIKSDEEILSEYRENFIKPGESIPSFSAVTSKIKTVKYADIKGKAGSIFIFIRSIDWCPVCKAQVKDWNERVKEFTDLGYSVAVITHDDMQKVQDYQKKEKIKLILIPDAEHAITRFFRILNTDYKRGDKFFGTPNPAIYVINAKGVVTHRFAEKDLDRRPQIDAVKAEISKK